MRPALFALACLAVAFTNFPGAFADDGTAKAPVVVELFTSQGCSSCPDADAFLGEIAKRDDVVALSFHVDYWNYIGWEDRFATPQTTARQAAYKETLGLAYVYTPQMVINGARHEVGSDRDAVTRAVARAQQNPGLRLPVTVEGDGAGGLRISIPAAPFEDEAVVWLATFDRKHATEVTAGENTGRTMVNHHVVRNFRPIARWRGEAMELALSAEDVMQDEGADACAVILQQSGNGPIIGAGAYWLSDRDR